MRSWLESVPFHERFPMLKAGAALLVAGIAYAYPVWLPKPEREDFMHVADVVASLEAVCGKRLIVPGTVACGSIVHRVGSNEYRFKLRDERAALEVRYSGLFPDDAFGGRSIIVIGRLGADGVLDAGDDGVGSMCRLGQPTRPENPCRL